LDMVETDQKFSAAHILEITGGRLYHGPLSSSFKGISTDSRTIRPGELFIALRGERFNGNDFISQAFENDAGGAIVEGGFSKERIPNKTVTVIEVEDTLRALGDIARFWRMKRPVPVVGVTGSNGKTTTKEMISAILDIPFNVLKTEGNFNNLIGLPLTLLRLRERDEVAVLEMGTNARCEIKRLAEISVPDIAIITNIGQAHLLGLRGLEEVAKEKGALFRAIKEDGFIIINKDDPRVLNVASQCKCRKVSYSVTKEADLMAKEISPYDSGKVRFRLFRGDRSVTVHLPIHGVFNVGNALAAAGVAEVMGVDLEIIKEGLEGFTPLPGRMKVVESSKCTIINDTYNANPNSMEQALKTLVELKGTGKAIAVLGDMLELGEFSRAAHTEIGRLVSELGVDSLLTLGEESGDITHGALEHGMDTENIFVGKGHQEIVSKLRHIINPGDCILIKGSRAMSMELILEEFTAERK